MHLHIVILESTTAGSSSEDEKEGSVANEQMYTSHLNKVKICHFSSQGFNAVSQTYVTSMYRQHP
uniref:Uncharacterized protein n=1 Tax=Arundo donax TaxID=35708 RepID=A0A0A9AKW9_ARUDO